MAAGLMSLAITASANAAVLYDQTDNAAGTAIVSTNFLPAEDLSDAQAADDFTVPAGETWSVTEVFVMGLSPGAQPTSNVAFYKDNATLPGAEVTSSVVSAADGGVSPNFALSLPAPVILGPGHYWVSVQRNSAGPAQSWTWRRRSVASGDGAVWRNPGNGFALNCIPYTRLTTCLAGPPDLLFKISGDKGGGLSVTKAGSGTGTVAGPAGISCGAVCSGFATRESIATFAATADPGSAFTAWSGVSCPGFGGCSFTVTGDTALTATFVDARPTFGKLKRNTKAGTGKLTIDVPVPGKIELAGKNLKKEAKLPALPGDVVIKVVPKGKLAKKLDEKGKAKAKVDATFFPDGGPSIVQSTKVKLKKS